MARNNNDEEERECVTFWGAVGANMVSGLIVGAGVTVLGFLAIGIVAGRASAMTLEGLRAEGALPPVPPPPGG